MSKTMLNIKIDSNLKRELKKTADSMGLPVSVIINNAARKIVEQRFVTFQVPLIPNEKTSRELKKTMSEIKAGKHKNWSVFKNIKDMDRYLDSL